jgi:hypothetical protein
LPLPVVKFLPALLPELDPGFAPVPWLWPALPPPLALWLPPPLLEPELCVNPPLELRPPPELELWLLPELKLWPPPKLELCEE